MRANAVAASAAPADASRLALADASERSFVVRLRDGLGLSPRVKSQLPSFDGRVAWQIANGADGADAAPCAEPDLWITLTRDVAGLGGPRTARPNVSVLVGARIPIGLRDCGPIVACPEAEIEEVVLALAQSIFWVALADQVVSYDWSKIESLLRSDCILTVSALPAGNAEAFAAAAINAVAHFHGRSRVEPDGLLLGIASPGVLPLTQRRDFTRPLLALAGHNCQFLAGVHTQRVSQREASLLLAYPIPGMPSDSVRPLRARRE
ncbi:hypothetical protein [Paraburkholderia sp. BL17N1]|uniref:hypothetical protein n=1 Tax=Paraburkholderia sp. BL17N1 TaxID=1938798 RepID=UPI000EB3E5B5|nr:hypothetical protein [Paraburkholderia sp. BL17N1]RKR45956.1 hypothetical protein B0G82_3624 [Paraburkholderia sp. BL17N1]